MSNPIMDAIGNAIGQAMGLRPQDLQMIKMLIGLVRNANNPMAAFQNAAQQNPELKKAYDCLNQNGGDPQQATFKFAKDNNLDVNEMINSAKQLF